MAMTDRKKPGVAFWATVVVGLLVLYVASIGPAVSVSFHHASAGNQTLGAIYRPLFALAVHHDKSDALLRKYIHLCGVSARSEPLWTECGIVAWANHGAMLPKRKRLAR